MRWSSESGADRWGSDLVGSRARRGVRAPHVRRAARRARRGLELCLASAALLSACGAPIDGVLDRPRADAGVVDFERDPTSIAAIPRPIAPDLGRDARDVAPGVRSLLVARRDAVWRVPLGVTSTAAATVVALEGLAPDRAATIARRLAQAAVGDRVLASAPLADGRVLVRVGDALLVDDGLSLRASPLGQAIGPIEGLATGRGASPRGGATTPALAFSSDALFALTSTGARTVGLPPDLGALVDVVALDDAILLATTRGLWSVDPAGTRARLELEATGARAVRRTFARTVALVGGALYVRDDPSGAWRLTAIAGLAAIDADEAGLWLLAEDGAVSRSVVERVAPIAWPPLVGPVPEGAPRAIRAVGLALDGRAADVVALHAPSADLPTLAAYTIGARYVRAGLEDGDRVAERRALELRPTPDAAIAVALDDAPLASATRGEPLRVVIEPRTIGPGAHTLVVRVDGVDAETLRFDVTADVDPTYTNLVRPLFVARCQTCHDVGQVARRLDDAARWRAELDAIVVELRAGRMPLPPYRAVPASTIDLLERWRALGFPE